VSFWTAFSFAATSLTGAVRRDTMKSRTETLAGIKRTTFDLCVIGGGATGAGCALDARLRGLKTVLVDAGDFASGSSSASTKLVHGGVRYLQQAVSKLDFGQYRVVRRALRERKTMLDNAPHLAHPLELVVPCFNRRDLYYFRAGMKIYDWMSGKGMLSPSHCLSAQQAAARVPRLAASRLAGAITFFDGQFDDARYGIELTKTFAQAGGLAVNYARVIGFQKTSSGKLMAAEIEDCISHEHFTVRAAAFVNATGPFSDEIREFASPGIQRRLRLSRGVHILLPLDEGFKADALLIPKTDDGRVIFAIPWLGRLLVGTTEDEATLNGELIVTREDVDYLLRHLNSYLAKPFTADQVVSAMAGLRPLVSHGDQRNTQSLIRDHEVEVNPGSGLISILGGKWTTYRAMAADTVNTVQRQLGLPVSGCLTQKYPLCGALLRDQALWERMTANLGISVGTFRHLVEKFGSDLCRVLELAGNDRGLVAPIAPGAPGVQAEIVYSIRYEMAMSIEDVLARRIGLQWFSWESAIAAAPVVGAHFARECGWTSDQVQQAVRDYQHKLARMMAHARLGSECSLTV